MKLAIIGGGASGLFLASYIKRLGLKIDITIYERNKGLGRKILASGNGKCNFMNFKARPSDYNNPSFMEKVFSNCPKDELLNYFQSLGLLFKFDDEGRMYPVTESSQTILDLFVRDLKDTNILLQEYVTDIKIKNDKVLINNQDEYDFAVIASGSNASIDEKKAQSTYSYLKPLGLNMIELRSSLVGFKTTKSYKLLSGYRAKCKMSFFENDDLKYVEKGEVIFKDDGISGICVMNASSLYNPNSNSYLVLDFLPHIQILDLMNNLSNQKKVNNNPVYYLSTICHPKMRDYLIKNNLTDVKSVACLLKAFRIGINDVYGFKDAQVLKGGISLEEINGNFSLKKYNQIYALGEALDIDGRCGGYNLLFAFTSAYIAAKDIVKRYENKNK